MKHKLRFIFISLIFGIAFLRFNTHVSYASPVTFSDDFESGNLNKWIVVRNLCGYNGQPAQWKIINGKLDINIDSGSCVTELTPTDEAWNSLGNDYSVDFDMTLVSGTDHNFSFRFSDTANWYDFHIQSPSGLTLQRMNDLPEGGSTVNGNFTANGQTIHFRLIILGDSLKIYYGPNSQSLTLLVDQPQMGNYFPSGKIALQASAGSDPISHTLFDNVVVTSINASPSGELNVPLLKQTAEPWQSDIYDSANIWNPSNPTINHFGCAITSAAMVFNYYGITKMPDSTPLDPRSLNNWLKSQPDGYVYEGWVNWLALSRLSKIAKANNPSFTDDALEYQRVTPHDSTTLTNDIQNGIPDILEEPGHFIVAKGINEDTFNINDPFYNRETLDNGYNNTFLSLGRYVKSQTDLSYIMLTTDQNENITVLDENNNSVGEQFIQQLIADPLAADISGSPFKMFYLPKPSTGKYTIALSQANLGFYTLNIYLYDKDGNVIMKKITGVSDPKNLDYVTLSFNHDIVTNNSSDRIVTFDTLINDINSLIKLKKVNIAAGKNLLAAAKKGKKDYQKNKELLLTADIQKFIIMLNVSNHKLITSDGYNILYYDIQYLKSHLLINTPPSS